MSHRFSFLFTVTTLFLIAFTITIDAQTPVEGPQRRLPAPPPSPHTLRMHEQVEKQTPADVPPRSPVSAIRDVEDVYWWDGFRLPGANGSIRGAVIFRGDLVVTGDFTWIGETAAASIARWDGTRWNPLGSGLYLDIYTDARGYCLAVHEDRLIVGGEFVRAGGAYSESIAAWDGETWDRLDGGLHSSYWVSQVHGLLSREDYLYVTGWFWEASGQPVQSVARWDGEMWFPAGEGIWGTGFSITEWQSEIVVGGDFDELGYGTPAGNIASFDGFVWSTMSGGTDDRIWSVCDYGSYLVAGGNFTQAGGVAADYLAHWDGESWLELGGGADASIYSLAAREADLFVAGHYHQIGEEAADGLARWDGSAWEPIPCNQNGGAPKLTLAADGLIATGSFTNIGSTYAAGLAHWDGADWSAIGGAGAGFIPDDMTDIKSFTSYEGQLVVGGNYDLASGLPANGLAMWDGQSFSEIGTGFGDDSSVYALQVYDGDLAITGLIWETGGIPMSHIITWDGSAWNDMAGGVDSKALALTVFDGKLIASGWLESAGGVPALHIAAWDGEVWSNLGPGRYNRSDALAVYQDQLFADDPLGSWDGVSWTNITPAVGGAVYALVEHQGELIVGGSFSEVGDVTAPYVAAWNGETWRSLGNGLNGRVYALASDGEHLVAGGEFTATGVPDSLTPAMLNIASWDGQEWHPLGSGTNGKVQALHFHDGKLYAGGEFELAGGKSSTLIARWDGFSPTMVNDEYLPSQDVWQTVNYPNPFNPSTEILFNLTTAGSVSLRIYDTSGRHVRTLLDGQCREAGKLRVTWDGCDSSGKRLPSGVYFYEVEAGEYRTTRKMTLLK